MNKKLIIATVGVGGLLAGKAVNSIFSKKKVKNVKPMEYDDILESLKYHDNVIISKNDQLSKSMSETIGEIVKNNAIINDAKICIKNAYDQVKFMKSHPEEFDDEHKIKAIEEAIRDLNVDIYQLNNLRSRISIFDPM